jgi:uncharacterized repeat protein (TIGR01451 family)
VPVLPALTMVKSSPDDSYDHAGQQVSYAFTVTNNSAVTYSDIQVQDTQQPPAAQGNLSPVSCPQPDLAAGDSETCTATYTVTAADIDHGILADSATATGTDPTEHTDTTARSSVILPAEQAPAVTVVKSAPSAQVSAAGDTIGYNFTVTNAGNVTLSGITVTDTMTAPANQANLSPASCPDPTLAPGATETCTATYTVTQADVDHGSVSDTATVTGTPPSTPSDPNPSPLPPSPPSALSVPVPAGPDINIVKSATPAQAHAPGDVIAYRFTVTNTGTVTLTNVAVNDTVAPPSDPANLSPVTCPVTTLAPGASTTFTATYTVTQADLNHGSADNTATAAGTPPSGPPFTSPTVPLSVPITGSPALTVVKKTSPAHVSAPGAIITDSFDVTNTGNVPLTNVTVTDTVTPPSDPANLSPVTCPVTSLAPGTSMTCAATYTVTQADIDHGKAGDSATATGTPPSGPPVTSPPSGASVPAVQHPGIAVVKTAAKDPLTLVGELIHYSFLVTNTGNVTLTKVGVTDVVAPSDPANLTAVTCPHPVLAPRASISCTATYTVTAADVALGSVGNTATAYGTPPSGHVIRSRPHTISFSVTSGPVLIPTGEGASAPTAGASPGLAAAGAAALAAGAILLARRRRSRHRGE